MDPGAVAGDPIGDVPADPPTWLTPSEFYRMVFDTLPDGYRQHAPPPRAVQPDPDLDAQPFVDTVPRHEKVFLPSSGLLRALYLTYGGQ